jgi:hypothetical protein
MEIDDLIVGQKGTCGSRDAWAKGDNPLHASRRFVQFYGFVDF